MTNDDMYEIKSTSNRSWDAAPVVLYQTGTTRLMLDATLVDNPNDPTARFKVRFRHERKRKDGTWETAPSFNLASLKAGQFVQFALDTQTTKALTERLLHVRELASEPLRTGTSEYRVVDPQSTVLPPQVAEAIKGILGEYSEQDLAAAILRESPTLAEAVAFRQQLAARRRSLDEFKQHLQSSADSEAWWQSFLQREQWILGFGAVHQFLSPVGSQPVVRPPDISGTGSLRGDYLMVTAAASRFTVLVEIKKPTTTLLHPTAYRPGIFHASRELSGAVAQVQAQIYAFEESVRTAQNIREFEVERGIYTFRPRAVLVVGNTMELANLDHRRSFELYRRQVISPDIVTYDELLFRAEQMLDSATGEVLPA